MDGHKRSGRAKPSSLEYLLSSFHQRRSDLVAGIATLRLRARIRLHPAQRFSLPLWQFVFDRDRWPREHACGVGRGPELSVSGVDLVHARAVTNPSSQFSAKLGLHPTTLRTQLLQDHAAG